MSDVDDWIGFDPTRAPDAAAGEQEVTISGAIKRNSKNGDPMIEVTLRMETGRTLKDWIMLDGGGKNMGLDKLKALGVDVEKGGLSLSRLVGHRIMVDVVEKEGTDGRTFLNVNAKRNKDGWTQGYKPLGPPPGEVGDIPF